MSTKACRKRDCLHHHSYPYDVQMKCFGSVHFDLALNVKSHCDGNDSGANAVPVSNKEWIRKLPSVWGFEALKEHALFDFHATHLSLDSPVSAQIFANAEWANIKWTGHFRFRGRFLLLHIRVVHLNFFSAALSATSLIGGAEQSHSATVIMTNETG